MTTENESEQVLVPAKTQKEMVLMILEKDCKIRRLQEELDKAKGIIRRTINRLDKLKSSLFKDRGVPRDGDSDTPP